MMQRIAVALLFAALGLPLTGSAAAAPPAAADDAGHHPGMHHDGHRHDHAGDWDDWFRDLKLTAAQKQSLKDIGERYRPRLFALRDRGETIRDQLIQAAPQDADYAARTQAASQAAGALAADGVTLLGQMRAEMDSVLTPVQRQALKDKWSKRKEQFEHWKDRHGGTGKPGATTPAP